MGGMACSAESEGGNPEEDAVALAAAKEAAALEAAKRAAKRAGDIALDDGEWMVKGKDGKVKIVTEKKKTTKKSEADEPADPALSSPAAPPPAQMPAASSEQEKAPKPSAGTGAVSVQAAGDKPKVRVSQVVPPEELKRREREEMKLKEASMLKAGWREGVMKQTMTEGHRSAISCLCIVSGSRFLSGGFDGILKEWALPSGARLNPKP
jgi:hypothetical protein